MADNTSNPTNLPSNTGGNMGTLPTAPAPTTVPDAPAPAARPSISDSINAAMDRVEKGGKTPEPGYLAPPTDERTAPATTPAGGRQRDAQGRFTAATTPPAAAPAQQGAADTPFPPGLGVPTPPAAATAVAAAPAAPATDAAPASWRDEMKPEWSKVPAELRGYLHQREGELMQGFQQVANRANVAEAVLREFAPYAEVLQAEGATPVTAMRTLLSTAHALRTGGPEYRKAILLQLAHQYGVDLSNMAVNPEMANTQARLAALESERMYGQASQSAQLQQQVEQQFQAFANDPANEFFGQVRGLMAGLISNGIAPDLKSAYDMALGMEPTVRATLMDREIQKRQQANAGLSVSGAPVGGAARQVGNASLANGKALSLRDSISAAFEGH